MSRLFSRLWQWLRQLFGLPPSSAPTTLLPPKPPSQPNSPPIPPVTETNPVVVATPLPGNEVVKSPPPIGKITPQLELTTDEPPHYHLSNSLFTFQESKFYLLLVQAVGNRYQIFAKVRLADFVWLANYPREQKYHRNQILCKHVDFLLCERGRFSPILIIELDDSSHKLPEHQTRDEFKNKLFEAVGLPLLRLDLQKEYSVQHIREQIDKKLQELRQKVE